MISLYCYSEIDIRAMYKINHVLFIVAYDDQICGVVAHSPHNYLVPHPDVCSKFYMCQYLGNSEAPGPTWKAHLMECPPKTGFEKKLMICNWLTKLPRCSDDEIDVPV